MSMEELAGEGLGDDVEAAAGEAGGLEAQRVATPGVPLRAVGEGRVDVGPAPRVHGEAPLVDIAGEEVEGELEVGAHGRDGADDASRAAGEQMRACRG